MSANQADNSGLNVGAVYAFTRHNGTWIQQAYLKASNAGSSDSFGRAVDLSHDGNTLVVGASGEAGAATGGGGDQNSDGAPGAGAVYVFVRSNASWTQHAYVKASNTDPADGFGFTVTLSDDGNTMAVSSRFEDSAATGVGGNQADNSTLSAGAVYMFSRSGATWARRWRRRDAALLAVTPVAATTRFAMHRTDQSVKTSVGRY